MWCGSVVSCSPWGGSSSRERGVSGPPQGHYLQDAHVAICTSVCVRVMGCVSMMACLCATVHVYVMACVCVTCVHDGVCVCVTCVRGAVFGWCTDV